MTTADHNDLGAASVLYDIDGRTFGTARRGYDRAEVDNFLRRVSEAVVELQKAQAVALAESVGGGGMAGDANISESAATLEEAEARAARKVNSATLEADRLRTEARRTLEKANKEAKEIENVALAAGERIKSEATEVRQQILKDLLRRRKEAQTHVEMLRAARDELLDVLSKAQMIVSEAREPLEGALEKAKEAADAAAERIQRRPEEPLEQFDSEIQTGRLTGVIPVPVESDAGVEAGAGGAAAADVPTARLEEATVVPVTDASSLADGPGGGVEAVPVAGATTEAAVAEIAEAGGEAVSGAGGVGAEVAGGEEVVVADVAAMKKVGAEAVSGQVDGGEAATVSGEIVGATTSEPELESIFARLRESSAEVEESGAAKIAGPGTNDGDQQQDGKQTAGKQQDGANKQTTKKAAKSKKKQSKREAKKSSKKSVKTDPGDSALQADSANPADSAVQAVADDSERQDTAEVATEETSQQSSAETTVSPATPVAPEAPDTPAPTPEIPTKELEDLRRQIKRVLTSDESKALQAIHRLHAKGKHDELLSALTNAESRQEAFAEVLPADTPASQIQNLLAKPLSESLAQCDISQPDTKAVVQQVREAYREFSNAEIASVVLEFATYANSE